jgi:sulfate adenylyltransferase subunit 1
MIKYLITQWRKEKKKDIFKMEKQIIRISTAGSVDDGKSTLLGRLLFDSKNLNHDDIEKIKRKSNINGEIDFSLFTDGLKEEQEQGITIDVAYRYFSSKKRKYIVSDTPGHVQYTRNMITGGSLSNVSIVLIDVKKGITEQTKRHLFLSSLLNINHIIICVNKMDLVDYSQQKFETIKNEIESFCSKLIIKDLTTIPISALKGDNIINFSSNMEWYKGSTLMYRLDNLHVGSDLNKIRSRMFVQNIIRTKNNNNRFIQGRIQSGIFRVGDLIQVYPNKLKSKIVNIINGFEKVQTSFSPMSISLEIEDDIDISRGNLITKVSSLPKNSREIEVVICWMDDKPLDSNQTFKGVRVSEDFRCRIVELTYKYNIEDLSREFENKSVGKNDIFKTKLKISKDFFHDSYTEIKDTGSFILVDNQNNTVCCGMII